MSNKKILMNESLDKNLESLFLDTRLEFKDGFDQRVMEQINTLPNPFLFEKKLIRYSGRMALIGVAALITIVLIVAGMEGGLSIDSLMGIDQIADTEFSSLLFEDSPF